jgi:hypothetical protein
MSAGRVDPYQSEPDEGKHGNWRRRMDIDSVKFVNQKAAEENYLISRDPLLFFSKNYHDPTTGHLLIKDAFFLKNDENDSLALAFHDCLIFFDVQSSIRTKTVTFDESALAQDKNSTMKPLDWDTEKAITGREFLLNPRTVKHPYQVFMLEQSMLWMSKGDHPMVYSPNSHERKISCFKSWDEPLEIIYEKTAAYLLYILTKAGEVLILELRPNLCNLRHKIRLPEEILPLTLEVSDSIMGKRILKTASLAILDENLLVYSKVTNQIYQFPAVPKQGAPDYNPTSFSAFELLGLTPVDLGDSGQNSNFSLDLMKHDEIDSVTFFLMTKTVLGENHKSSTVVKSFYLQKRVIRAGDEDFDDDTPNDVDWWVNFMNSMKIPLYLLTIFVVIGANLWWRSKKKADEWQNQDKQNSDKYSGVKPNLLGGFKNGQPMSDYDKFGQHEKAMDGDSSDDEPNEKQEYCDSKKKTRFSDQVGASDQMGAQLEGLINNTNALAGQQHKLKSMVDALKR